MSASARTRIGVVGAGNIASIAQLPTLVKRDDVELAALVSRRPDPGALMRRWGFGTSYGTIEDMVRKCCKDWCPGRMRRQTSAAQRLRMPPC